MIIYHVSLYYSQMVLVETQVFQEEKYVSTFFLAPMDLLLKDQNVAVKRDSNGIQLNTVLMITQYNETQTHFGWEPYTITELSQD